MTAVLATAASARIDLVEGPLKGHHHQTYAVPVDAASPLAGEFRWLKLREPREVRWYDMRQFASEEQVTEELHGWLPHIPRVLRLQLGAGAADGVTLAEFIEGATLDRLPVRGRRVPERFTGQLAELFAALGAVGVERFLKRADPECPCAEAEPADRDSTGFLRQLVHFTVKHVYEPAPGAGLPDTAGLFEKLGVPAGTLAGWQERVPALTPREPRLLHGDLHRRNLVVDRWGALWPIDWDLALVGDPLYELATHLHLMGYPMGQQTEVARRWRDAVGAGASRGMEADLGHYLDFKRLQSVCTDVIRGAARVAEAGGRGGELRRAAAGARKALAGARRLLGLGKVPTLVAVEAAFEAWWRDGRD